MLFYVDKCKVVHFGKKNQEYAYYTNDHKLDSVTAEKDLEIWISHGASKHHSNVLKHIQRRISYWES